MRIIFCYFLAYISCFVEDYGFRKNKEPGWQVRYDLILKVETLESDWEVLRRVSGLELPGLKHLNSNNNNHGIYRDFISQLSPPTLQKIYNIFRLDFELFGYSLDFY